VSDYLKNYELGWKTMWLDKRLAWNGALFHQNWDDFQFSYLARTA
jgi:outer membrane receptor protein involved in Fe transport